MALSAPGALAALLGAQRQSFWNRLRHESALGGRAATAARLGVVGLLLLLPGYFAVRLGRSLAEELLAGTDPAALGRWNGMQAVFTVGFALLGSFRLRPVFDLARLGHYPIAPLALLLAEIPAGMFEVFPLLGGAAIVLTHVGLASAWPRALPLSQLLAAQGLAAMLALLFLAAAARRWLLRHRLLLGALAIAVAVAGTVAGGERLRWMLRAGTDWLVARLPGSIGAQGLLAVRTGRPGYGLAGLGLAFGLTLAALGLSALAHHRERSRAPGATRARRRAARPLRFGSPAAAIAGLHCRALLASKSGRLSLAMPALLFGPFALVLLLVRSTVAATQELPADLAAMLARVESAPVLAWSLVTIVLLSPELWMNQFGWDRAGVRGVLVLPLAAADHLRGKLYGLARFAALQGLVGALPLLLVYRLEAATAASALGAGATAFVVLGAAGQYFSLRFPRAVAADRAANLPLHLSWIPTVLGGLVVLGLVGITAIAAEIGPWAPPLALLVLAAGAAAGYRLALPTLAKLFAEHQERLLGM